MSDLSDLIGLIGLIGLIRLIMHMYAIRPPLDRFPTLLYDYHMQNTLPGYCWEEEHRTCHTSE